MGVHRKLGQELGDAEVEDDDAAVAREEEVVRLEIAVDDALGVGGGEGVEELAGDGDGVGRLEPAESGQQGRERLAGEELHDDRRPAVGEAGQVEDAHDALVADPVDHAGLGEEALDQVGAVGAVAREHLDGDAAADGRVDAQVDAAHAAGAEERGDPVGADHLAEQRVAVVGGEEARAVALAEAVAAGVGLAALGADGHVPGPRAPGAISSPRPC
jgi:hypothetical protein